MKTKFYMQFSAAVFFQFFAICAATAQQSASQTFAGCAVLPVSLTKHLVAYYPFCGNANDASGNNNNPTVNTAVLTADRFGNANSAYIFDGSTSQYIKGSSSNYPANERTVSIWFKEKDLSNPNNEIMGYGGGTCGSSFFITFNESNHPGAYTATGHCEANNCSTPNSYPPSKQWNNLIITTGNGKTKFYLNGSVIDSFTASFNNTSVAGKDFSFGSIPGTDGIAPYIDVNVFPLKGSLDDIVIYNVAFDAKKVKKLYNFFNTPPATSVLKSNAVNSETANKLLIYPNPSKGMINVPYKSTSNVTVHFTVYDTNGKIVYSKNEANEKGTNNHQLNLSFIKPGIYFLELNDGQNQKQRLNFIIEK